MKSLYYLAWVFALTVCGQESPVNTNGTPPLQATLLSMPQSVAVDQDGNLFVGDLNGIWKITPSGVFIRFVDNSENAGGALGKTRPFRPPLGVAIDPAGNLIVADAANHRIRKVTPAGKITTLAGIVLPGHVDSTGSQARFNDPRGVAVDHSGNIFVADATNNAIRKITPAGVVTTLAGKPNPAGSQDGPAAVAQFNGPRGVAVDSAGNVFVADTGNNLIRKISPDGNVSTLAGSPERGDSVDGTGSEARFNGPRGLAVDRAGNVFVADTMNETIRKITPAGLVTTLAGMPRKIGKADGKGNTARFFHPKGVAVDSAGNVFVADTYACSIRKITPEGVVTTCDPIRP